MHSSARNCYLAYVKSTRPTGRTIGKLLDIPFGFKSPEGYVDVLVRWGSRKPMPSAKLTLNSADAIARASDKIRAFEIMTKAGVRCVPVSLSPHPQDALGLFGGGITVFGRKRTGMGGKDIKVFRHFGGDGSRTYDVSGPEYQGFDFFSYYINPTREFRIHVVGDKIVRLQGKYCDHPDERKNPYIRNYENGYRFRTPRHDLRTERKQQAILAVKSLGLDFGAVDILMDSGGSTYVLEVNTAPACSPLTAKCYAGALALMVDARANGIIMAESLLHEEMPGFTEE